MSASTATLPNGKSHLANGHSNGPNGSLPKASSAKSRGALKRLKAKQKAAKGADSASEAGTDVESSDTEVGLIFGLDSVVPSSITRRIDRFDANSKSVASTRTAVSSSTPSTSLESLVPDFSNPAFAGFADVFAHFEGDGTGAGGVDEGPQKGEIYYSDDEEEDEETFNKRQKEKMDSRMTRRERRRAAKLTVAELKQMVERPEVVEWFDCDARDPRTLVSLKSYRNTVPVPVHWNAKRDYLAGKRGLEKPPYLLPEWIAQTGIGEQRDAVKAKDADQTLRQKTRERVQPKMGKIDIDYQKLHDAFFKFQGKPSMTKFGEAYYEGKELETDLRMKKPGELSDELVEALSIPPLAPPPWLIAMQRFGPPPSYPNLRIRGLNAPIPPGAQWGFHPGGWGKPPMDDFNRPLYGDVFGVIQGAEIAHQNEINRDLWGEIEPMEDEEEEEESEEEGEEGPDGEEAPARAERVPADGMETPSGLATPSGFQSVGSTVPGGLETPDFVDLRKNTRADSEDVREPRDLYTVIPERETSAKGFMGSSTAYDLSNVGKGGGAAVLGAEDRGTKVSHPPIPPLCPVFQMEGRENVANPQRKVGDVDVSIDLDEDLSQEQLKAKYEASRSQAQRVHVPGADADRSGFEDVVAGEMKKRQRKDEAGGKKGKEKGEKFKF